MSDEENVVLRDFDAIDAELGDGHVLRLITHLSNDTPRSQDALNQLHLECLEVFSKYPHNSRASTSSGDRLKKKAPPKRAISQEVGRLGNQLKPTDIANRMGRERAKIVTQHPPTSKPQILLESSKSSGKIWND